MFAWLKRWLGGAQTGTAAAPPAKPRRIKTYASESGHVYEYTFEGRRCCGRETAFLFDVTTGREASRRVVVELPESSLAPFEKQEGRRLAENERYGIAKIALFRLFDESSVPTLVWSGTRITASEAKDNIRILAI